MASLNQSGRSCELRLQAWLCTFYLAPLSGCSDPRLSDPELLRDHSRISPARFPECSGHASPRSGYAPGGSGSQKRREVGPKTERAGLEISAENIYNSAKNISSSNRSASAPTYSTSQPVSCVHRRPFVLRTPYPYAHTAYTPYSYIRSSEWA